MSFVPGFSVTQTPAAPNELVITDTSTGFDFNITQRRVYIEDYNGNYIVPSGTSTNYTLWLNNQTITLDVLSNDLAVNIKVEWLDQFNYVLYQTAQNYCLSEYNKQYFYYLIQAQSQAYNIVQDNRYWQNMATYWTNIVGANKAIELGNDVYGSQVCLNRATFMKENASNFF